MAAILGPWSTNILLAFSDDYFLTWQGAVSTIGKEFSFVDAQVAKLQNYDKYK